METTRQDYNKQLEITVDAYEKFNDELETFAENDINNTAVLTNSLQQANSVKAAWENEFKTEATGDQLVSWLQAGNGDIAAGYSTSVVTPSEAKSFLQATGYNPTDAEVRQFAGQLSEDTAKANISAYVNPRQVTESEARSFLQANGYNPTDEEVKQFVGQISEDTAKANISDYVNPRQVTPAEARLFLISLGYTNPTDAEINQFVSTTNDPNLQANTYTAVSTYVDPRQVTEAEARSFLEANGYYPTDAEVRQFVS